MGNKNSGNPNLAEYWQGYRDAKRHCSIWGISSATTRADEILDTVSNKAENSYWQGFSAYIGKAQTDAKEWYEMKRDNDE
ncbi:MAG: hypothetical protein IJX16_04840 [Clostridia bacterium]|nr:hypothetical protein [Clostridia bacterium]